jgi:hypothetical protein
MRERNMNTPKKDTQANEAKITYLGANKYSPIYNLR